MYRPVEGSILLTIVLEYIAVIFSKHSPETGLFSFCDAFAMCKTTSLLPALFIEGPFAVVLFNVSTLFIPSALLFAFIFGSWKIIAKYSARV